MTRILVLSVAALLTVSAAGLAWAQDYSQPSTPPPQEQTTQEQASTTADPSMSSDENLPATASPLPLVALGSVGALAAGAWLSRRRSR
jgi:hypothetical protein